MLFINVTETLRHEPVKIGPSKHHMTFKGFEPPVDYAVGRIILVVWRSIGPGPDLYGFYRGDDYAVCLASGYCLDARHACEKHGL